MTLFLASVTGPDEAETAIAGGADIIDLKDPSQGALGALPVETVRAAVAAVRGRRPVSAVAGDLPMEPEVIVAAAGAMAQTGVDYVKVGLFPGARRGDCIRALASLAQTTKIVGVMFADQGADAALIADMASARFAGAMLDTAGKTASNLLDHRDIASLGDFVAACRERGLLGGLAGSLEPPDIPRLLLLVPDLLGFRRALCGGQDRAARLDPVRLGIVRGLIPPDPRGSQHRETGGGRVDYRLLAARGYSVDPARDDSATDRIFVRDFDLPIRVGAYARERDKAQRVRFNVDVQVLRLARTAEDMRDVFSYDVITDGIRVMVAHSHVALLETLAERIAAFVLGHPRVVRVTVRVEKLDIGPAGVGVEIRRERPAEVAKVHHLYPGIAVEADPKAAE